MSAQNWSEMDFVTVLAAAYPLYAELPSLETHPDIGYMFVPDQHGENAAAHARMAGDDDNGPALRREHALQAIAHLGRLIERIDETVSDDGEG